MDGRCSAGHRRHREGCYGVVARFTSSRQSDAWVHCTHVTYYTVVWLSPEWRLCHGGD